MSTKPTYEELRLQIKTLEKESVHRKQAVIPESCSDVNYHIFFKNSIDALFITTPDGGILEANPAACRMFGYTEKELIQSGRNAIVDLDDKNLPLALEERKKTGKFKGELIFKHKDGTRFPVEITTAIYKDAGGTERASMAIRDLTDRKAMERALRESEKRFRQVYYHMSTGVAKVSLEFKIEAANPAYCNMLGYHEDELIGKHLRDITHPEVLEENLAKQSQLASGEIDYFRLEKRFIHKNKNIVHGILDASLVRDGDGNPVYFFGSVSDITEHKYAENALRESENRYRSIMNSMKDAAYICTPELCIEYMNPKMVSRVGRDATGDYCYKAIYNSNEKCSWCVFDNILQGEQIDYELADPRDNRYYSVANSPIHHSSRTISKLTIFHDITDNKAIEAQLHQARKMESIGTMAGGIAHDFNNILYMIIGNTELAMEDVPEWNPAHENLIEIKSAGLRAAGIVKQLLNFSRKTEQELKPINAVLVIKDALKFMRSTIPVTIEIQKNFLDQEVTILGDSTQINQIIMNLCMNAYHSMEELGGVLDIHVERKTLNESANDRYSDLTPGEWLKITVRDSGSGIRPDIIDRIFDPYFTTKDVGKGSGMGLAVVHGIVKNHHGTIYVESELGKGTTFTILFPVVIGKSAIEIKASDMIPQGRGEKILFVDDEAFITEMTEKMLKRLGYNVQTTTNPVDALELFRSKPDDFDLVLTDMTMPQMTGVTLSEKLKDINPNIPVVLCTGHSTLIDEEKAKSIGIEGYVMKPILMKDISLAIRKVLDEAKGAAQGSVSHS